MLPMACFSTGKSCSSIGSTLTAVNCESDRSMLSRAEAAGSGALRDAPLALADATSGFDALWDQREAPYPTTTTAIAAAAKTAPLRALVIRGNIGWIASELVEIAAKC